MRTKVSSNVRSDIYHAFWRQHKPPSRIDRDLSLTRGTARAEIVDGWAFGNEWVQTFIGRIKD